MLSAQTMRSVAPRASSAVPRSRLLLKVACSAYRCPYSELGVSATADAAQIKKAYRKLALKWHPDVSKLEGAEVRFLALTEAYEFLVGKLEGRDEFLREDGSSADWDFHDWYWTFRKNKTWSKQQEQKAAGDAGQDIPGSQQQETRRQAATNQGNIRSQMAGLRHRAAVRAVKADTSTAAATVPCAAEESLQPSGAQDAAHPTPLNNYSAEAEGFQSHGFVPFRVAQHEPSPQEDHASGQCGYEPSDSGPPEETVLQESGSMTMTRTSSAKGDGHPPPPAPRHKFVAHSGNRQQVFGQLAGLRRKASISVNA